MLWRCFSTGQKAGQSDAKKDRAGQSQKKKGLRLQKT